MQVLESDLDLEVMEEGQSLAERPNNTLVCSMEAETSGLMWAESRL